MGATFESKFEVHGSIYLPEWSGVRVMMLPIELGKIDSLPDSLKQWKPTMVKMFELAPNKFGIGYLTIDEKIVPAGDTHRRSGLHVDGVFNGSSGGWGGGGGGGWGSNGMLTVASHVGCRAWNQTFIGWPGKDGECDHLADQCGTPTVFKAGVVYQLDGLCVHESLEQKENVPRQFVRLSMPSTAPWFEGYTENPKGVKPTGPILPRRKFMDYN